MATTRRPADEKPINLLVSQSHYGNRDVVYETDHRSKARFMPRRGGTPRVLRQRKPSKKGASDCQWTVIPLFKSHANARQENRDVIRLILASVNHAHTVTVTVTTSTSTGKPLLDAIDYSMKNLEAHDLEVHAMLMHPQTSAHLGRVVGEELWEYIVSLGSWKFKDRDRVVVIVNESVPKGVILYTAPPDYVGVKLEADQDKVGLAVLNDYAVAKTVIKGDA